ncbi:MAG: MOSC N-terminal beta barrel domain-containing protein [Spongiibacteraceae bacterium]
MRKVGTVKEIWRYPVKGMAGETLDACDLGAVGLMGDRIWALRDNARQEIQSCKFRPELLLCSASCRSGASAGSSDQVDVLFPDGCLLGSDHSDIHARLSALTGRPSTLESLRPNSDLDFYRRHKPDDHTWLSELKATFEREAGEPLPNFFDDFPAAAAEFVALPGTFFLVTPFHVVTTATLAHLKKLNPQADWDARRFRPNVVIETLPGAEGLLEQEWIGKKLALGDASIDCAGTTPRCGAVTRAQRHFAFDKSILRTIVREADQNVGIYGTTVDAGELRVGDPVFVS